MDNRARGIVCMLARAVSTLSDFIWSGGQGPEPIFLEAELTVGKLTKTMKLAD